MILLKFFIAWLVVVALVLMGLTSRPTPGSEA